MCRHRALTKLLLELGALLASDTKNLALPQLDILSSEKQPDFTTTTSGDANLSLSEDAEAKQVGQQSTKSKGLDAVTEIEAPIKVESIASDDWGSEDNMVAADEDDWADAPFEEAKFEDSGFEEAQFGEAKVQEAGSNNTEVEEANFEEAGSGDKVDFTDLVQNTSSIPEAPTQSEAAIQPKEMTSLTANLVKDLHPISEKKQEHEQDANSVVTKDVREGEMSQDLFSTLELQGETGTHFADSEAQPLQDIQDKELKNSTGTLKHSNEEALNNEKPEHSLLAKPDEILTPVMTSNKDTAAENYFQEDPLKETQLSATSAIDTDSGSTSDADGFADFVDSKDAKEPIQEASDTDPYKSSTEMKLRGTPPSETPNSSSGVILIKEEIPQSAQVPLKDVNETGSPDTKTNAIDEERPATLSAVLQETSEKDIGAVQPASQNNHTDDIPKAKPSEKIVEVTTANIADEEALAKTRASQNTVKKTVEPVQSSQQKQAVIQAVNLLPGLQANEPSGLQISERSANESALVESSHELSPPDLTAIAVNVENLAALTDSGKATSKTEMESPEKTHIQGENGIGKVDRDAQALPTISANKSKADMNEKLPIDSAADPNKNAHIQEQESANSNTVHSSPSPSASVPKPAKGVSNLRSKFEGTNLRAQPVQHDFRHLLKRTAPRSPSPGIRSVESPSSNLNQQKIDEPSTSKNDSLKDHAQGQQVEPGIDLRERNDSDSASQNSFHAARTLFAERSNSQRLSRDLDERETSQRLSRDLDKSNFDRSSLDKVPSPSKHLNLRGGGTQAEPPLSGKFRL